MPKVVNRGLNILLDGGCGFNCSARTKLLAKRWRYESGHDVGRVSLSRRTVPAQVDQTKLTHLHQQGHTCARLIVPPATRPRLPSGPSQPRPQDQQRDSHMNNSRAHNRCSRSNSNTPSVVLGFADNKKTSFYDLVSNDIEGETGQAELNQHKTRIIQIQSGQI